jgi:drug/metabolite transporter (DMT)-like permease
MWALMPLVEPSFKIPLQPITWVAILWLGVLGSGIAMVLNYYLLHEIGPTRNSMVTYVFPPGGVLLGIIFLDEQLSWQLLAGAVLIVASLVIVNWRPKQ